MMRRSDREIVDLNEIFEVVKQCDVCRLVFQDGEYPYILPLNFGAELKDGKMTLYFHSAMEGYKIRLINEVKKASFEMDCKHLLQYFEEKGYCTYAYESVIGKGVISVVEDEKKADVLTKIMDHYHPGKNAYFNPDAMTRTLVYRMDVESVTGKRKMPK